MTELEPSCLFWIDVFAHLRSKCTMNHRERKDIISLYVAQVQKNNFNTTALGDGRKMQ